MCGRWGRNQLCLYSAIPPTLCPKFYTTHKLVQTKVVVPDKINCSPNPFAPTFLPPRFPSTPCLSYNRLCGSLLSADLSMGRTLGPSPTFSPKWPRGLRASTLQVTLLPQLHSSLGLSQTKNTQRIGLIKGRDIPQGMKLGLNSCSEAGLGLLRARAMGVIKKCVNCCIRCTLSLRNCLGTQRSGGADHRTTMKRIKSPFRK